LQVLLVDDHQLFRSGLKLLLANLESNIVFTEADSCESALNLAARSEDLNSVRFDVVLLDYYLPGTRGLDALAQIKKHFGSPVVVLSSEDTPSTIRQVISAGASGFIPKSSSPEVLLAALKLVLAQGVYLPPHVLDNYSFTEHRPLSEDENHQRQAILSQLSQRQQSVLIKAAQGKPNKVIAQELFIAEGTVKAHLSACYRVLGVDNRTEAVYATASLGLVPSVDIEPS